VRGLAEAGGGLRFWLDRLTQFIAWSASPRCWWAASASANAISSFLAGRLHTIATMKCLGAPERLIFTTYLIQLAALAVVGVAIGLAIGARLALPRQSLVADILPVRARVALYAGPLASPRRSACWSRCCLPPATAWTIGVGAPGRCRLASARRKPASLGLPERRRAIISTALH